MASFAVTCCSLGTGIADVEDKVNIVDCSFACQLLLCNFLRYIGL